MTTTTILGAAILAILTAIGSIVVALIARASSRQTTAVAFSETLIRRLDAVEAKVSELETALSRSQKALQAAIRFIDRLVEWGGGNASRPKPPPTLHEYLDADIWGNDTTKKED